MGNYNSWELDSIHRECILLFSLAHGEEKNPSVVAGFIESEAKLYEYGLIEIRYDKIRLTPSGLVVRRMISQNISSRKVELKEMELLRRRITEYEDDREKILSILDHGDCQ